MSCTPVSQCRCCGNSELKLILDLNNQPLANSYHRGNETLNEYPLAVMLCQNCFHSQLSVVVDPDEMFSNYLYISGTSKTLDEYFDWFADMVQNECGSVGKVLDIACNDGTQLSKFKSRGWITHGIDPAKNLYDLACSRADAVACDYLNEQALELLGNTVYDVITAQNVFAHTHDVVHFLNCCKQVMSDHSKLYIQTSQADMIENRQFDTIYHEHLSFFSTRSMLALCERVGLKLISVRKNPIHGGSYIFCVSKTGFDDGSVERMINAETLAGRYSVEEYDRYRDSVEKVVRDFKIFVDSHKNCGTLVVGYGAAAKGNTFLNYSGVKLHFIVDDNQMKQGLLTPGSDTMIVSPETIQKFAHHTVFVPLAWNFYQEIKTKIQTQVDSLPYKSRFSYMIHSYYPNPKTEVL